MAFNGCIQIARLLGKAQYEESIEWVESISCNFLVSRVVSARAKYLGGAASGWIAIFDLIVNGFLDAASCSLFELNCSGQRFNGSRLALCRTDAGKIEYYEDVPGNKIFAGCAKNVSFGI